MKNAHKRQNRIRFFRKVSSWSGARRISSVIFIKAFIRARRKSTNCRSVFFQSDTQTPANLAPCLKFLRKCFLNLTAFFSMVEKKNFDKKLCEFVCFETR